MDRGQQAQQDKASGMPDTKDRMGKPKAGNPINAVTSAKTEKFVKGGTVVSPVRDQNRTTDGI